MNPEFQRNLWLEAGPRRIAWTAAAVGAVYLGAVMLGEKDPIAALGIAGAVVFVIAGLLWGPRIAGRAVGDEVAQRTWDFQRLSALEPWSMTWGKLFGATSLSWLAAVSGLALAVLAAIIKGEGAQIAQMIIGALAGAVVLQAGSMALALVGVRRARAEGRSAAFRFTFGGFIALFVVAGAVGRVTPGRGRAGLGLADWIFGKHDSPWWGVAVPPGWLIALSLAAFAGFAVLGAWRLMRLELQMRNFPWAWPLFVVFLGVWSAGFATGAVAAWAAAGLAFAMCAYASAFAEPAERVRMRQFMSRLGAGRWMQAAYDAPAVIGPLMLSALALIGLTLSGPGPSGGPTPILAASAFAFLLRDIGIIAYFRFGPRPGRGDFGAVVALFLAYFVGGVIGINTGAQGGLLIPGPSLASVLAGSAMAAIVWALAWKRIREPEKSEA